MCLLLRLSLYCSAALIICLTLSESLICLQSSFICLSFLLFRLLRYQTWQYNLKQDYSFKPKAIDTHHKPFLFTTFGTFSVPQSVRPQSDQQWSSFSLTFFSKKIYRIPRWSVCSDHHKAKRYPLHVRLFKVPWQCLFCSILQSRVKIRNHNEEDFSVQRHLTLAWRTSKLSTPPCQCSARQCSQPKGGTHEDPLKRKVASKWAKKPSCTNYTMHVQV